MKYYDPEIFVAAGNRIRNFAKSADEFKPTERVKILTSAFTIIVEGGTDKKFDCLSD